MVSREVRERDLFHLPTTQTIVKKTANTDRRKSDVVVTSTGDAAPAGDNRVASIYKYLDKFDGFPRSEGQRRFHTAFVRASRLNAHVVRLSLCGPSSVDSAPPPGEPSRGLSEEYTASSVTA